MYVLYCQGLCLTVEPVKCQIAVHAPSNRVRVRIQVIISIYSLQLIIIKHNFMHVQLEQLHDCTSVNHLLDIIVAWYETLTCCRGSCSSDRP